MLIYEEIVNYEIHSAIFYVDKYKALRNAYYVASHILIRHKRNRAFQACISGNFGNQRPVG